MRLLVFIDDLVDEFVMLSGAALGPQVHQLDCRLFPDVPPDEVDDAAGDWPAEPVSLFDDLLPPPQPASDAASNRAADSVASVFRFDMSDESPFFPKRFCRLINLTIPL